MTTCEFGCLLLYTELHQPVGSCRLLLGCCCCTLTFSAGGGTLEINKSLFCTGAGRDPCYSTFPCQRRGGVMGVWGCSTSEAASGLMTTFHFLPESSLAERCDKAGMLKASPKKLDFTAACGVKVNISNWTSFHHKSDS